MCSDPVKKWDPIQHLEPDLTEPGAHDDLVFGTSRQSLNLSFGHHHLWERHLIAGNPRDNVTVDEAANAPTAQDSVQSLQRKLAGCRNNLARQTAGRGYPLSLTAAPDNPDLPVHENGQGGEEPSCRQ